MAKMTLDNAREAIRLLEEIDPNDEFAYEKALWGYKKIALLPGIIYAVEEGIEVFRTRTHFDDVLFKTVSDISLPPNEVIKSFARCNRPFQSKFYCSENRPTSYMELVDYWLKEKNVGENLYATIGRWRVKRSFTALIVTSPDMQRRVSNFDRFHGQFLDGYINEQHGEGREAYTLIYQYLFDKFRKAAKNDPHTYLITSAYCNIILSMIAQPIDAIYFPSVPFDGQGVNFAFNSEFIQGGNLELLSVLRDEFEVELDRSGKKSFMQIAGIEAQKIVDGTRIVW